jgi:hypothetical protein
MKKILTVGLYIVSIVALVFGLAAVPTRAADHLDAPGLTPPGGDTRLDITDVYAFQSPTNPARTVVVIGVNPLAGVLNDGTFNPDASYEIHVDNNGDAISDRVGKITFSAPDMYGNQRVTMRGMLPGGRAILARGWTDQNIPITVGGGGMIRAGVLDDPFFFDLNAFLGTDGRTFCDGGENNFFQGLNISAIVVEFPSVWLGSVNVGIWARTVLNGQQIDRMGRPAINTVFIPNNPFEPSGSEPSQKNAFNAGAPANDQANFRGEVVDTLEIFYGAGNGTAQTLADILLPDMLSYNPTSSAGFLNGRGLADDVIDVELGLVTNGIVPSDCVANDSAFSASFPYLAPANP